MLSNDNDELIIEYLILRKSCINLSDKKFIKYNTIIELKTKQSTFLKIYPYGQYIKHVWKFDAREIHETWK